MVDSDSAHARESLKAKRIARRVLELITAATFLLAALYWPTTNPRRLILIGAVLLYFIGLKFLSKWPSV